MSALTSSGWHVLAATATTVGELADEVRAIASDLGKIVPGRRRQTVEQVIPYARQSAYAGSLSSRYGLEPLPLHTDTAHWPTPCRYLVMACASPGPVATPTMLLNTQSIRLSDAESTACERAAFLVRNGRYSFYGSITHRGRDFIRFDLGCMSPLSVDGAEAISALSADRHKSLLYRHEWKTNEILLIDNWHVLHGRGDEKQTMPGRVLLRAMVQGQVTATITSEGLLAKSRVYVQRAFRAKVAKDLDEYQLWASLALELLGKAALADIHPSLVVDPNHYESLFAASGMNISTDVKTISASTLYKRLGHLSKYFDTKVKDFCDKISLRRNAELHSGELPFHQMQLEAWESRFWQAADIIAAMLKSSLEEWIGADLAKAPKELVAAAAAATCQAAKKRVEQAADHFLSRSKKDREDALALSKTRHAYHYPNMFKLVSDHEWEVDCPACTGRAFLAGIEYGEDVLDTAPGETDWEEEVEKQYGAEEFRCPT